MRVKPRSPARPGLSLVDANKGRLITYQDDVLGIKHEIEQRWAGLLSVAFDTDSEEWVIVEHCQDGTDRLVFTTTVLSQGTIDRLQRADQSLSSYRDPNQVYEEMDREEARQKDHSLAERVGDAAERLFYALRRDGIIHAPRVYLSNSARRARGVT